MQEFLSFAFGNGPGSESKNRKVCMLLRSSAARKGGKKLPVDLDSNFFRSFKDKDEAAPELHFILEVVIHFSAQWKTIPNQMKLFSFNLVL